MKGVAPDRRVAAMVSLRALQKASGIVDVRRGRHRRMFCLSSGWLVFVRSNVIEEQYAEYLAEDEIVERAALDSAKETALERKIPVSQVLLESGSADETALRATTERMIEEMFFSCLEWDSVEVEFLEGKARLDGEVTARVSPVRLVFRHARRYPASSNEVIERIGGLRTLILRSDRLDGLGEDLELDAAGQFLVGRSDGGSTIGDLLDLSPVDREETLRTAYGLLLAGLLEPATARTMLRVEETPDGLTREECIKRLAAAEGGDHYQVLGVEATVSDAEIREAYYATARRYHPDRFRSGPLVDLLPRFEQFFTWVTAAYNVLSKVEERAAYDEALAGPRKASKEEGSAEQAKMAHQNFLRGRLLLKKSRFVDAATFLENAVLLDPSRADHHLEFGLVLLRNPHRKNEAERHLLRAAELSPTAVRAYVGLAQLFRRQGRKDEALANIKEALRWDPENAEASALRAELEGTTAPTGKKTRGGFFG